MTSAYLGLMHLPLGRNRSGACSRGDFSLLLGYLDVQGACCEASSSHTSHIPQARIKAPMPRPNSIENKPMNIQRFVPLILIPLVYCAGCALPPKPAPSQSTERIIPPADTGEAPVAQRRDDGLTSELVYETLAGEIASQRGAYQQAFQHAMRAAEQSRDPAAAERATHMALQLSLIHISEPTRQYCQSRLPASA